MGRDDRREPARHLFDAASGRAYKKAGEGVIIVVSSINGTRTFTTRGATAYSATKAAQLAMVQQLAVELGKAGIRVNAICPGAIETNIDENTEQRGADESGISRQMARR
jgi:NAD(P)-dependent dehydrogenase (short-subunit alcohol dehydrogenase family)